MSQETLQFLLQSQVIVVGFALVVVLVLAVWSSVVRSIQEKRSPEKLHRSK